MAVRARHRRHHSSAGGLKHRARKLFSDPVAIRTLAVVLVLALSLLVGLAIGTVNSGGG